MQITKLKAQMITENAQGKTVKRNFNNVRPTIQDDELRLVANAIGSLLDHEKLNTVNLTANSALSIR